MSFKKWILIVAGLLIVYTTFFSKDDFNLTNTDLTEIELIVDRVSDIGSKSSYEKFKITSKNFPCKFVIDNSGGKASDWTIEDKLLSNDKIKVGIDENDLMSLKEEARVRIYSLKKDGVYIFTLENYKKERNSRNLRYDILGYISLLIIGYHLLKPDKKSSH